MESRSLQTSLTAVGTRMPYGITQCYLSCGRGKIPTFTQPIKVGIRFCEPRGMDARL